ncbi:MAG: hypothetical protein MI974_15335 [Chitinophagales bacterium]|nr:hypothetical protein [Chitinophagales bacterium]
MKKHLIPKEPKEKGKSQPDSASNDVTQKLPVEDTRPSTLQLTALQEIANNNTRNRPFDEMRAITTATSLPAPIQLSSRKDQAYENLVKTSSSSSGVVIDDDDDDDVEQAEQQLAQSEKEGIKPGSNDDEKDHTATPAAAPAPEGHDVDQEEKKVVEPPPLSLLQNPTLEDRLQQALPAAGEERIPLLIQHFEILVEELDPIISFYEEISANDWEMYTKTGDGDIELLHLPMFKIHLFQPLLVCNRAISGKKSILKSIKTLNQDITDFKSIPKLRFTIQTEDKLIATYSENIAKAEAEIASLKSQQEQIVAGKKNKVKYLRSHPIESARYREYTLQKEEQKQSAAKERGALQTMQARKNSDFGRLQAILREKNRIEQNNYPHEFQDILSLIKACNQQIHAFPEYRALLEKNNRALCEQQNIEGRLGEIIAFLEERVEDYEKFGGDATTTDYGSNNKILQKARDLFERFSGMEEGEIIEQIENNLKAFGEVEGAFRRIIKQPLLPNLMEMKGFFGSHGQGIGEKKGFLSHALHNAQVANDEDLVSQIQDIQKRLETYQQQVKSLKGKGSTPGQIGETIQELKPILAAQEALYIEFEDIPDLKDAAKQAYLQKLGSRNPHYADLIDQLLQSGRVLDPVNLMRELRKPVESTKYPSRIMELESLLDDAQRGAFVQVGRMKQPKLLAALRENGLNVIADQIAATSRADSEFEADGISYYSADNRIEAVQHKMTKTTDPLRSRTHASKEITEPEFEKQLKGAVNQLSGLTAHGGTQNILGGIPETPPPGAIRIANLRFTSIDIPAPARLVHYESVIKRILSGAEKESMGPRSQFVERIRLHFRNGVVEYNKKTDGIYTVDLIPQTGEPSERQELDVQGEE